MYSRPRTMARLLGRGERGVSAAGELLLLRPLGEKRRPAGLFFFGGLGSGHFVLTECVGYSFEVGKV